MKTYKDITSRYLKENKLRTIVTIIGISLSVALITAIASFGFGLQKAFIDFEIKSGGDYHNEFINLTEDEFKKMSVHAGVEDFAQLEVVDIIKVETLYDYKADMQIHKISSGKEYMYPLNIIEGEFAKADNEITLDEKIAKEIGKKIGDVLDISIKGKEQRFNIVGITNTNITDGVAIIHSDSLILGEEVITRFKAKDSRVRKILDELNEIGGTKLNKENSWLLTYLGQSNDPIRNQSIAIILGIIILLVIVSTVLVIKNAFYISIVSRLREFGLLKAVGATSTQLKKMVLKEASIIAGIAIPLGILFGVIAVFMIEKVLLILMPSNEFFKVDLNYKVLILVAILGTFTTYICAIIPAAQMRKISVLSAIDNRNGIKKEQIKKRKFKLKDDFINFKVLMGIRNIRRSKKRYRATILALSVSMILFIVLSGYLEMFSKEIMNTDQIVQTEQSDITVHSYGDSGDKFEVFNERIDKIEGISKYNLDSILTLEINVDKELVDIDTVNKHGLYIGEIDEAKEYFKMYEGVGILTGNTVFEMLEDSLVEGSIDKEKLIKGNGVIVNKENMYYGDSTFKGSIIDYKIGDKIYLNEYDKENNSKKAEFEVIGIVNNLPSNLDNISIIASEEALNKHFKLEDSSDKAFISIDKKSATDEIRREVVTTIEKFGLEYVDYIQINEDNKALANQLNFLIYGFLLVIGVISCTNIFNTMYTNILFRKKEIAGLRAIGMTSKELKKMIITEGVLYGFISSVYAVIIGVSINYLIYFNMQQLIGFTFSVNLSLIIKVILIAIIVGTASSIIPLKFINKTSIIEDLKSE